MNVKKLFTIVAILTILIINCINVLNEKKILFDTNQEISKNSLFKNNQKNINEPFVHHKKLMAYNLYISNLAKLINSYMHADNRNTSVYELKFVYIDKKKINIPLDYIPQNSWLSSISNEYGLPIFLSLYLNNFKNYNYGYLYKTSDKRTILSIINKYKKTNFDLNNDEITEDWHGAEKRIALKFLKLLSQFYKNEDLTKEININDYSIHHPSYFFKANRVLIFNSQELDYVKNNFNNEIIKININ